MSRLPESLVPDALPLNYDIFPDRMKAWIEEAIWGHRFYNDQTPWLLLCECLGLCVSLHQNANFSKIFPAPPEKGHEVLEYEMARRSCLRYLLFRDRDLETMRNDPTTSEDSKWIAWLERAHNNSGLDFAYLRDRFRSFNDFRNSVELLKGAEIEPYRQRRYTSRHLAPLGPHMLTADFGEKGGASSHPSPANKDRRFFARGGELLYLMLSRSGIAQELEQPLAERLLSARSKWDQLAARLQPDSNSRQEPGDLSFTSGYLPLLRHPRYEVVAQDWRALLTLDGLPTDNLQEPLMRVSGLAVVLYLLERTCETLQRNVPPLVIDMISSDTRGVRGLAKNQHALHRHLTREAVAAYIDSIQQTEEWQEALGSANPSKATAEILNLRFAYEVDRRAMPARQLEDVKNQTLYNHNMHLARVGAFYAEQIGLAVARRGVGRWYGASDGFLEALILANVRQPVELDEFLDRMWNRYRIVIGPRAAEGAFEIPPIPHEQFKSNQSCLEERLRVLGFAHRLSDDCAFVSNPYYGS